MIIDTLGNLIFDACVFLTGITVGFSLAIRLMRKEIHECCLIEARNNAAESHIREALALHNQPTASTLALVLKQAHGLLTMSIPPKARDE